MARIVGLGVALTAGFVLFYLAAATPRPAPADAPSTSFSASRAMTDVRTLGGAPHPLGSAADAAVRDQLVVRMRELGLSPRIQRASSFAVFGTQLGGGVVDNVVGVLPGRDPSAPALALMAHHDSVPGSPGAADDTAGVATALEIARAIKAMGVPRRDVILVITDGEEAGMLGARAFFAKDPLAAHIGYVINLETRGGGGRTLMFETSPRNGGDVALLRRTAYAPNSNSLDVLIYRAMPNDTDFTVAKAYGEVGLNYAFIGRQFDYHSPSSTPAALDQGALQHMGAQVLPTAAALAFGPLPPRAPDLVYSDLFGLGVVAYPPSVGWGLIAVAAGLIGFGALAARRRKALSLSDGLRGLGASLYVAAAGGAVLELARKATGVGSGWIGYRPILARFSLFEVMMLAAALSAVWAAAAFSGTGRSRKLAVALALGAGLGSCLFQGFDALGLGLGVTGALAGLASFGHPTRVAGGWSGLLIAGWVVAVAVQLVAPMADFIIAWPLLAAALVSATTAAGADTRPPARIFTLAVAAAVFAWLGGLFHGLMQGLDLAPLGALPAWLAALLVWPCLVAEPPQAPRLWPAAGLLALALTLAAGLHLTSPWSARYPSAAEPVFVIDADGRRAWRASLLAPGAWVRQVLGAEGGGPQPLQLPFRSRAVVAAPARLTPAPPSTAALSSGPNGRFTLTLGAQGDRAQALISLRSAAAPVDQVTLNGDPTPYKLGARQDGLILWNGPDPLVVSFTTRVPGAPSVQITTVYPRWFSAQSLPATPADEQLWDLAGSSLVINGVKSSGAVR